MSIVIRGKTVLGPDNTLNSNNNISNLVYDSLLMYYDASRYYSYPNSGYNWIDLSSNNKNVTFYNQGGTTYSLNPPGPPVFNGNSLEFDGINDFGVFNSFTIGSNVTVSAWVKCTASGDMGIFSHCSGGPVGIAYAINNGKMSYDYYTSSWQNSTGTNTLNDGNWKYIVWAKNGTNMKTYINNVLDKDSTLTGDVSGNMRSIASKWGPCNSENYGAGTDSYP
jgi:hypothetical protein